MQQVARLQLLEFTASIRLLLRGHLHRMVLGMLNIWWLVVEVRVPVALLIQEVPEVVQVLCSLAIWLLALVSQLPSRLAPVAQREPLPMGVLLEPMGTIRFLVQSLRMEVEVEVSVPA